MMKNKEAEQKQEEQGGEEALAAYRAAHGDKNPPKTAGEKLFNNLDYYGLGWGVNSAISIHAADAAEHTYLKGIKSAWTNWWASRWPFNRTQQLDEATILRSKEFLHKLTQHPEYQSVYQNMEEAGKDLGAFFKAIDMPKEGVLREVIGAHPSLSSAALKEEFQLLRKGALAHNRAGQVVSFCLLNLGGWAMLAPMKWLEDCKERIVETLDRWLGSGDTPAKHEAMVARHEFLKHEPKQTWTSELLSRTINTPVIIGLYYNTRGKENLLSKVGVPFEGANYYAKNATNYVTEALRESPATKGMTIKAEEALASRPGLDGSKRFDKIVEFSFIEVVYSLIMATLVFLGTRILGPIFGDKREAESSASQPVHSSAVSAPQPEPVREHGVEQKSHSGHRGVGNRVRDAVPAGVLVAPEVTQNFSMNV